MLARAQQAEQAQGKGGGAAGDGRTHNGAFTAEKPGKHALQRVPANIVVAVARGGREMPGGDVLRVQRVQHAPGVF